MNFQPINIIHSKPLNFGIKNPFLKLKREQKSCEKENQELAGINENLRYSFFRQIDEQNQLFKEFLSKEGKLTIEEYAKIKKHYSGLISRSYAIFQKDGFNSLLYSSPKNIANAACGLCLHYDKMYGKGNYKILSVGTSPSPIAEAMRLWDSDLEVIFAPISSLEPSEGKKKMASKYSNIATLMKYCSQKGIAKDKDKRIIVLDYVQSGRSLDTMGQILAERKDIPLNNIRLHSVIQDLCESAQDEKNHWVNSEDVHNITMDMYESRIGQVSNVPHFFMDEDLVDKVEEWAVFGKNKSQKEIFREFDNFSKPQARAFALCVANEMLNCRIEKWYRLSD